MVPEIASRAHVRQILPVIDEALRRAGVGLADLGAVAVATRPGLVGALVVGLTAAKALALALDIPLVAVDHLEGHLYACQLAYPDRQVYPCVGLVVSGGHTSLYAAAARSSASSSAARSTTRPARRSTRSPACSGLGYPGGPEIERAAQGGQPQGLRLPALVPPRRPAGLQLLGPEDGRPLRPPRPERSGWATSSPRPRMVADLAASFQEAVVDVLVAKTRQALVQTGMKRLGVGGGVAANARFRERLAAMADEARRRALHPAAVALHRQRRDGRHRPGQARRRPGRRPRHRRHRRPGPPRPRELIGSFGLPRRR